MRKILVAGMLLCLALPAAFAQIDPPLARVRLTKMEVITQRQFKEQIDMLEQSLHQSLSHEQRSQILQALIDEKVLLQAAERDRIRVSSPDVDRAVEAYRSDLARQLRRPQPLTDTELRQLIQQQGSTMEKFTEQVKNKITVDKLIATKKKAVLDAVQRPTASEVMDVYESNKTKYPIVSPEMVRFKQILLVTTGLDSSQEAAAKARAEEIYRGIQNGESFDKFQEVFLDTGSAKSRVGGLSFETWRRDDDSKRATYGRDFVEALFRLNVGQRSVVLKSNVGLHIVEVIEKIPFGILGIDDKIPPQNAKTVREYITESLMQREQMDALRRATESLVAELRKEAEIQVDEKLLDW